MTTLDRSRREFLRLSALLTTTAVAPNWASADDQTVRIGYLPITDSAPLLVAHARGFFAQEGLSSDSPRLLRSWSQVIEAFMAGQVNVVHLLSPMTIWARYGSQFPAKITAWNHMAGSALTVAPQIEQVRDLGGQRIAIPFWYSIHNVVLQKLLREAGLDIITRDTHGIAPHQVSLVVMAPADMGPALANGAIAGFIVAEPFNAAAETQGIGKILRFTGDVWNNHACCVVFQHERDLTQRPEWSQKVVNAIVNAQHWMRSHREESALLLSREASGRYTPFPAEVLQRVLVPNEALDRSYLASGANRHHTWNRERIDFQPWPFPSYTQRLVEVLKDTTVEGDNRFLHALDPIFVANDLVETRFVRQAIEALGGLNAFGISEGWERSERISI